MQVSSNTLTRTERGLRPVARRGGPDVRLRPHRVRPRAHRQLPDLHRLDVLRRMLAISAGCRCTGDELHRCGRSDDRRVARRPACRSGSTPTGTSRRFQRTRRRSASSRSRRCRARHDEGNLRAMSDMVAALETNGHTYRSDGSIYFRIATLPDYGQLSASITPASRPAHASTATRRQGNARDFVLWKATISRASRSWDFGVGPGRPGWHIECSAMALRVLGGPPIVIPLRRRRPDLPAPRERDRAEPRAPPQRSSRAPGSTSSILLMDEGEKMSKSLGNVFTVKDVLTQGYRASALRYQLLSVHYRKQLRFAWSSLAQCEEALKRLMDFLARLDTPDTATGAHPGNCRRRVAARDRASRGMVERRQRARRARRALRAGARAQRRHRRGEVGDATSP